MNETVLILGANGRFGRVAAQAFAEAGWNVVGQVRKPLVDVSAGGVSECRIAVTETARIAAAAAGASVVVNAMSCLYTRWDTEALPLNTAAIEIARALHATLMFPGNVYNYGSPIPAEITESTPQRFTNRKGEIRCQMEAGIRVDGLRSVIVRAGDFFGGPGSGSWMDQAILRDIGKGRITYPGPRHLEHPWAYLPDLARTFVQLAEVRDRLAAHDAFHFPGHTLSGDDLIAAITRAARRCGLLDIDRDPAVKGIPWSLIRIAGILNPMLRELARMSYLWREPHRLSSERLMQFIGEIPHTALDTALDATLNTLPEMNQGRRSPGKNP
jgi:nucleoside-diphosphate-sugar epimerase